MRLHTLKWEREWKSVAYHEWRLHYEWYLTYVQFSSLLQGPNLNVFLPSHHAVRYTLNILHQRGLTITKTRARGLQDALRPSELQSWPRLRT